MEENAGRTHKNARLAMISSAADTDSAIFRSLRRANFGCDDELACVGGRCCMSTVTLYMMVHIRAGSTWDWQGIEEERSA